MKRRVLLIVVLAAAAVYLGLELAFGCPIRGAFGTPCPGCGLTRAYLAAFKGNMGAAFTYHPLFFVPPAILLMAGLSLYAEKRRNNRLKDLCLWAMVLCAVLFFALYLYRLVKGIIP